MENRKLYYILVASAFSLVFLSYLTGFFVGKHAGFIKAKAQFDVEKQSLMKTLATMKPISRPVEERKTVIVDKTTNKTTNATIAKKPKTVVKNVARMPENKTASKKVIQRPKAKVGKVSKGNYYLQLGIFKNKSNAVRLAKKVQSLGLNAKTILEGSKVKVIVGYLAKDQALSAYKLLKAKGILGIIRRRN